MDVAWFDHKVNVVVRHEGPKPLGDPSQFEFHVSAFL